jgi:5-methylcytosine-specific restriction endonuclease McrA
LFLAKVESKWFCSIPCSSKKNTLAGTTCVDCGAKREHYSQRCAICRSKRAESVKHSEPIKRGRKQAKARRRARGKAVISAPVSLADVVRAHGKRCHLCGKAVDLSTTNQPKSATMDHVVPLALGGWHDLSNLRPAHHLCNSLKGAQFTGQLMLTC